MRKNLLSLSIAAMIGGLGLAASAGAVTLTPGTAATLSASGTGVGHILLVPYFSTQNGNSTLLSIVNSDTQNGKAVKVRFRSAANSDDVYDFQLYLSPSDVWTANVSQAASGLSQLTTADTSCTLPSASTLNTTPFVTNRLPAVSSTFTAAQQNSWTREGYVEILNMADIPASTDTSTLSYAITHANGVPPGCPSQVSSASVFSSLAAYSSALGLYTAAGGLRNPTGGLFGGATIINTSGASVAWSGNDYALMANGSGNMVFSPQMATPAAGDIGTVSLWTADPLMVGGAIAAADYDLPDLSTPYVSNAGSSPATQADLTGAAFATTSVMNEYLVAPSISAATDWTFTLPTRRYAVAYNYAGTTANATVNNVAANKIWATSASPYFAPGTGSSGNVTVGTSNPLLLCVSGMSLTGYGQEEQTLTPSGFVISPNQLAPGFNLCGEASVLSFAATSVLGATVAPSSVATTLPSTAGWLSVATPGLGAGLPILGASYEQATGPVVAGKSTNFGISYQHRYTRAN